MANVCIKELPIRHNIRHNDQIKFYFGLTANNWEKKRFYHPNMILNNKKYANTKALSKFDWGIKSDGDTPAVN